VRTVAKCELCGKGPQFGHNVSHSMVRTKRQWRPNVQKAKLVIDGVEKRLNVCANCLKTLSKD
jgi:large subunit ribosomal protein L28